MNIEAVNAVMREQARIREAVVKLPVIPSHEVNGLGEHIKREDVLAILSSNHGTI